LSPQRRAPGATDSSTAICAITAEDVYTATYTESSDSGAAASVHLASSSSGFDCDEFGSAGVGCEATARGHGGTAADNRKEGTGAEQGVNVAWLQGSQLLQGSSSMGGPSDVLVENSVIETTNLGLRVLLKRQSPLKFVEDVV
jgi:hypothetical protein